jgi:hypothetical protein
MKNLIILFIVLMGLVPYNVSAQNNQSRAKQIETIKIGFITRKLDLSIEESQKFWPVYFQFQKEQNLLLKQKREARLQNANDADQAIDDDLYFDTKILELKKKYRGEYGKILSAEKVKKLYQAEREFKEELIKLLKTRTDEAN